MGPVLCRLEVPEGRDLAEEVMVRWNSGVIAR